jgi:hypothetical protein
VEPPSSGNWFTTVVNTPGHTYAAGGQANCRLCVAHPPLPGSACTTVNPPPAANGGWHPRSWLGMCQPLPGRSCPTHPAAQWQHTTTSCQGQGTSLLLHALPGFQLAVPGADAYAPCSRNAKIWRDCSSPWRGTLRLLPACQPPAQGRTRLPARQAGPPEHGGCMHTPHHTYQGALPTTDGMPTRTLRQLHCSTAEPPALLPPPLPQPTQLAGPCIPPPPLPAVQGPACQ